MSVTSGFFNSKNHDRRYNARQISMIFDGIINDGVYMGVGNQFAVTASGGLVITVGTGRCWFNHTWLLNDATRNFILNEGDVVGSRYDAVVIRIDEREQYREATIYIKSGEPSANPVKPEMTNTDDIHEYPIAYIFVGVRSMSITQQDVEDKVGSDVTPFVTGIIDRVSIERLTLQWADDWYQYITSRQRDFDIWSAAQKYNFEHWEADHKAEFDEFVDDQMEEMETWASGFKGAAEDDFNNFLQHLRDELDSNQAAHLQNEIDNLAEKEFYHFNDIGSSLSTITKDATGNITQIVTTNSEGVSTAVFNMNSSGAISSIITTLVPTEGTWKYIKKAIFTDTSIIKSYEREAK